MINKDKRSLVLLLALGDGCLHYIKNNNSLYGGITIDHGIEQADYQSWKAKLLSEVFNKNVNMRNGHKGKSVQVSVCAKRLRAWRKFCYPNNKKSIPKILKFIRHPEMALAVWLMDDGYVEPSITNKTLYSASFRLFTCNQTEEQQKEIIEWFQKIFDVTPKVKTMFDKRTNKTYPFLKFTTKDSLKIWNIIREFALQFKSMQHKFRHIEQIFKSRCVQPPHSFDNKSEEHDIVSALSNKR